MNSIFALSAAIVAAYLSLADGRSSEVGHWERAPSFWLLR